MRLFYSYANVHIMIDVCRAVLT